MGYFQFLKSYFLPKINLIILNMIFVFECQPRRKFFVASQPIWRGIKKSFKIVHMDVKIHWISPATLWNSTTVTTLLLPDAAAANSSSESKTPFDFRHFIRIEKSRMKCDLFLSVSWHLFLLTFFNWSLHYSPITIIAFCKKNPECFIRNVISKLIFT